MPELFAISADVGEPISVLEPYRPALQLHCYRMTGSLHDAEDLVQETFLRAWRSYDAFKGESSVRTWLYRIATNVCLDALRKRRQPRLLRPRGPAADPRVPVGDPTEEAGWLQPYPDSELPGGAEGPEESLLRRENVSLAFCAVMQLLPPRQRAVLLLSDVLDWRSAEIAGLLDMTVQAVDSALHRARTALTRSNRAVDDPASDLDDAAARALLERYLAAWHAHDVDALVALLHQDAVLSMPPFPAWYQGRSAVHTILSLHPFGFGRKAGWCLSPTGANGQPAFVLHRADLPGGEYKAFGIMVLALTASGTGPCISDLTIYKDTDMVRRFGFPLTIPICYSRA